MTIVYVELSESRKYMKLRISIYDFRVLSQLSHCATWHHACAPSEFWRTCHLFFPSSLRLPPPPHPASNPLPLVPNRPKHHHQRVPHPSPVPFHAAATPNLKHRRNAQIGSPLAAGHPISPSTFLELAGRIWCRPRRLRSLLSLPRHCRARPNRPPCVTAGISSPAHVPSPPLVASPAGAPLAPPNCRKTPLPPLSPRCAEQQEEAKRKRKKNGGRRENEE